MYLFSNAKQNDFINDRKSRYRCVRRGGYILKISSNQIKKVSLKKIQNILEHLKEVNLETYTGCRFSPFKYWFSFTAFFPRENDYGIEFTLGYPLGQTRNSTNSIETIVFQLYKST